MLTGERRWLSARRGGMTVLGKVTVPKPINLPSQRLENHGLDPNVEIVPKGTINWGTRSSSSAQNAWASPAQSPPKIGGTGSPSHLNGRPSSSGSGTRPSTAGSDRSQEPVPNVWGPSSRPSSASGILTSNQTSVAAARPRSAEPRPASSQLSRFAEPISENSATWGASATMEKLGVSSSKSKNFSLSSGDFPTLGSEKTTTDSFVRQGHSSQGRPASASGRATTPKQRSETSPSEDGSINTSKERGAVNTSRNDNVLEVEAGDPPSMENWQRETKPYFDQNMPPQQFGPWHGTPHNPPNGVWYRGPFVGGPYGPPGPPGSYPHEPFAYYHPRLPACPAANMQPALQPGSVPSGYFPDKGHSHRPHMPDSYIQPVMPFGAGPYPVQVPYDGYYGPPRVGSCISSEQRPPVMGMATAPCAYNRYPIQSAHPDPGNFHGSSGYGPPSTRAKEQGGSGHPHGTRHGPYKVLLKNQDGWDVNDNKDKSEHAVSIPCLERDNLPGTPTREIGQEADRRHDEQVSFSKVSSDSVITSQYDEIRGGHSPLPVNLDVLERTTKVNRIDDSLVRKPQTASVPGDNPHQFMSIKRNPTLIEKIESLNNKARLTDGRYDEKLKSLRALCTKAEDTPKEVGIDYPNKSPTSGMSCAPTLDMNPTGDKRREAVAFVGADVSRPVHEPQASVVSVLNSSSAGGMNHHNAQNRPFGVQGRIDNRGKGRSNPPKDEEWRKKPLVADISAEVSSTKDEICDHDVLDHHGAIRASEKSNLNKGKVGGDMSASDPSDHQRAKMREIVVERARQLQKEEEERTREQKARAQAKLEELNKRMLAETSAEKVDHVLPQSGVSQNKGEHSEFNTVPVTAANTYSEVACSASGWDCDVFSPRSGYDTHGHEGSTDLPKEVPLKAPICAQQDPIIKNNLSSPLPLEFETKDVTDHKTSQGQNSIVFKQKQIGPKRKQNMNKNLIEKSIASGDSGPQKSHANVVGDANSLSGELNPPSNTNATDDSLLKHKKKNNRSGKNKHKMDEVSSGSHSPKLVPMDGNSVKPTAESNKPKTSVSVFEVGSVQVPFSIEIAEAQDSVVLSTDQGWSSSTEEVHNVVNNQFKPHPPRRLPRNTQGTRITEKFHGSDSVVWAPVGSLKKNEDSEDATLNSTIDVRTSSVIGRGTQNSHKGRRAEMERYVPKPVAKEAKELSEQGNTETPPSSSVKEDPKPVAKELSLQGSNETPPSLSVNQAALNGSTGRGESSSLIKENSGSDGLTSGKGGLPVVPNIGESKHNKHGKAHGLWRPRASGESPVVQPSLEESQYSSSSNKMVQKSFEKNQTSKAEMYLPKEQVKYSDNLNASNSPVSNESVTDHAVKDHGVTNRGKRQPFKGQKGAGNIQNNLDHNDLHGRDSFEAGSRTSIESNKLDGRVALGETHAVEKHVIDTHTQSHWQPKYQAHVAHSHQGSSGVGGQRASSRVGKAPKEYPTQGREHLASRTDKDYSQSLLQSHLGKSNERKTSVAGIPNEHHQETKPERKSVDSPKQNPHSADQHPANPSKLKDPPENVSNLHEQSFSGLRRQSHQSRSGRVSEVPHGAQNPGVQNDSKQQQPPSSERRKHDSHYEYQRARSNGHESIESFDEGSRFTGSRYREKGQTHSRRGGVNSYAQNSGTRVASASRDGEQNPEPVISHI